MTRHLAILLPLFLLSACVVMEDQGSPKIARGGGPPPWAPAHGHRAKQARAYYYYPSVGVYYDLSSRKYFYLSGGTWMISTSLPTGVVIASDEAVPLELETDRPYVYIDEHQKQYQPPKQKQGKKHSRTY